MSQIWGETWPSREMKFKDPQTDQPKEMETPKIKDRILKAAREK